MITRRGLLGGIFAAGFAPAAIGSGVLMPVRQIWQPVPFLALGEHGPGWYILSAQCLYDGSLEVWWDNKSLPKSVPGLSAVLPFIQTTDLGAAIVDRQSKPQICSDGRTVVTQAANGKGDTVTFAFPEPALHFN